MTTLVEDLNTLLTTLAPAGGVWALMNTSEPAVYPYIVFQRIVSTDNVNMVSPSAIQNTRVQVDIYARKLSDAVTLQKALEAAFMNWAVQNVPISSQDVYEDSVKAFRVIREFSVWATN